MSLPAGVPLRRALDHRDFTIRAIAWDPRGGAWMDPHDGRSDLAKGLLRAVGDAEARLAEDPCRALRAARLVAQHGLEVDAGLVSAMRRLGLFDVARVVSIGDTVSDLEAGANAGTGFNVGVLSGAHSREQLQGAPHTALITSVAELPELLAG